jgi:hypothetical protein
MAGNAIARLDLENTGEPCGSWLASDGGGTSGIDGG